MIPQIFKDNTIEVEGFNSSIFSTHYFISSWIKRTDLDNTKLLEKIDHLHNKDIEKDPNAKRVNYILCFETKNKKVFLVSLDDFIKLSEDEKVWLFSNWWDFYIPRSIWFKSFCMLNSESIPILLEELKNL